MTRVRGAPLGVLGAAAVGVVVLIGIPLVTDTFTTFEFANVAVFVIALIGLNILTGYSGQISIGNGAFMAVGGYTAALLIKKAGVPYLLTIPIAGVLAGLAGFLFGIPALRLSGIYLALATFALALALPPVINNYERLTGGNGGVILRAAGVPDFLGGALSNEQYLYYLAWSLAGVLFVFARLIIKSGTGRAFMALRDSETAAVASGVSLAYHKTLAFGLSAFYAGVAGALLAILSRFVHPDTFGLPLSIALLTGIVVGGLGADLGPVLGAVFVVWLPYFAEKTAGLRLGGVVIPGKPDIIYGAALILIVFLAPSGVAGLLARAGAAYRGVRGRAVVPDLLGGPLVVDPIAEPADEAQT